MRTTTAGRIGMILAGALLLAGCSSSDDPAPGDSAPSPAADADVEVSQDEADPVGEFVAALEEVGTGDHVPRPVRDAAIAQFQPDFEELISECVNQPDLAHTVVRPSFPDGLTCEQVWQGSSERFDIDHSTATFVLNTVATKAPGEVVVDHGGLVGRWHWEFHPEDGEMLTGAPSLRFVIEQREDSPAGWVITDLE